MKQWEYKTACIDAFSIDELNNFGKDGWELIQLMPIREGIVLYFKREIEKEITIQQVLDDIESKRIVAPTARVIYVLREEMQMNNKVYLSEVSFKHHNFGKKSQTELRELIEYYKTSTK